MIPPSQREMSSLSCLPPSDGSKNAARQTRTPNANQVGFTFAKFALAQGSPLIVTMLRSTIHGEGAAVHHNMPRVHHNMQRASNFYIGCRRTHQPSARSFERNCIDWMYEECDAMNKSIVVQEFTGAEAKILAPFLSISPEAVVVEVGET